MQTARLEIQPPQCLGDPAHTLLDCLDAIRACALRADRRVPRYDDVEPALENATFARELFQKPGVRLAQQSLRWLPLSDRRDASGIDARRTDDDLERMRHRVQEGGPPVHDRALLDLALDAEGKRCALQDGAPTARSEPHPVVGDLGDRDQLRRVPLRRAHHDSDPVTRAPRRCTYRANITAQSRSAPPGVRTTANARPTPAESVAVATRITGSPGTA